MTLPANVAIGILTYNSAPHIRACLESVRSQTWPNVEVAVLDNCSSDETVELVRKHHPDVRLLINDVNTGFSGGQNRLIRELDAVYYMPLNPDVTLEPDAVANLVKVLEQRPDAGAASGKLYFMTPDGEKTSRVYTTGHLFYRNGRLANIGYGEEDAGQFGVEREVFGVNGAAPLYRRKMLEEVAVAPGEYFDELYFMYGADPDLDWRARLFGWRAWYTPEVVGYHVEHASGGRNGTAAEIAYVQRRYVMVLKNAGAWDVITYYAGMIIGDYGEARRTQRAVVAKAIEGLPRLLPDIWCKRRRIMRHRKASRRDIVKWFAPCPKHQVW